MMIGNSMCPIMAQTAEHSTERNAYRALSTRQRPAPSLLSYHGPRAKSLRRVGGEKRNSV